MNALSSGLVALACTTAASAAAPPTFQNWLASDNKTLAAKIPALKSGTCGNGTLSGEAVAAVFAANMLLGDAHTKAFAALEAKYKIAAAEANAIYNGYYISVLKRDYGFNYAEVMYGYGWYKGNQPLLRGHVSEGLVATHQVYWKDGVFQKEFSGRGAAPSVQRGYPGELLPATTATNGVPGTVEGVLVLDNGRYTLWLAGTQLSVELASGSAPTPCTFTDVTGRTFDGMRWDTPPRPVAPLRPDPTLGLANKLHVASLAIETTNGTQLTDWVATKVDRLDGTTLKLDASRAADDADARFAKLLTAQESALASALDQARKSSEQRAAQETKARANRARGGPQSLRSPAKDTVVRRYGWQGGRLRIVLALEREVSWIDSYQMPAPPANCPLGAPCRPPPPFVTERVDLSYAAEVAAVYEYDNAGKLVREQQMRARKRP